MAKRIFDLVLSTAGLIVLAPVLLLIAIAIKLSDHGPVLFRQTRVGFCGSQFQILKFRTMIPRSEHAGTSVTAGGDPRVTRIGRFLRRTKLDELPQLWNVLYGDMSFVGPRPEVPRYVAEYSEQQRQVLQLRPGITDVATLAYRNEEELLRGAEDVEAVYLNEIMPKKIALNLAYAGRANLWQDTKVIVATVLPGHFISASHLLPEDQQHLASLSI